MLVDMLNLLLHMSIVLTPALLIWLPLRPLLRQRLGSVAVYAGWTLLPALLLASALPPLALPASGSAVLAQLSSADTTLLVRSERGLPAGITFAVLWVIGAVAVAAWLVLRQWWFVRRLGPLQPMSKNVFRSARPDAGPLLLGVFRPRIIVPPDFEHRYAPAERAMILAHERLHLQRGDMVVNAAWAITRCVFWFHPLVHLAAGRFRLDQELSCDAAVVERYAFSRRSYAVALLKSETRLPEAALSCGWSQAHPLFLRIGSLQGDAVAADPRARALLVSLALASLLLAWQGARSGPQFVALEMVAAHADGRFALRLEQIMADGRAQAGRLSGVRAGQRVSLHGDCDTDLDVLQRDRRSLRLMGLIRCGGTVVARPDLDVAAGTTASLAWRPSPGAPPRQLRVHVATE